MAPLRIHYLQHVPFEGLGSIETWIINKNHKLSKTPLYDDAPLPSSDSIDWLIVMGGPMSIHDEELYPWLKREKTFIKQMIEKGKPVLGICLGSQFLADAIGGRVYPGPEKEIGWFPIKKTPAGKKTSLFDGMPDELTVFQWHGDTFDLPKGTPTLIKSGVYANQAFVYGENVIGLQFHFEATRKSVMDIINNSPHEIEKGGKYVQTAEEMESSMNHIPLNNKIMFSILDKLETKGVP